MLAQVDRVAGGTIGCSSYGAAEDFHRQISTPFRDCERQILQQFTEKFDRTGFASRDIAGIILNRWGHAYASPAPGFYFGAVRTDPFRERRSLRNA